MSFRFSLLLFLFSTALLSAQNAGDALRFSTFNVTGTARFAGTGGALTPLGSDFSVLSTNPAGLGWYRSSEFVATPLLDISSIDALLMDAIENPTQTSSQTQFAFSSLGVVIAGRSRRAGVSAVNFGFGINRLADFNERFEYTGTNFGSITESFQETANAGFFDPFGAELAIDAGALFQDPDDPSRFAIDLEFAEEEVLIRRNQTVDRSGSMNELVFGVGGNVREKILWGLTLGVPIIDYSETRVYTERNEEPNVNFSPFEDLTYVEELSVTGAGINFKGGVIFRPVQPLRISLAVQSPTFFQFDDDFVPFLEYAFFTDPDGIVRGSSEVVGETSYRLNTPWRFSGGIGYLFGRSGFLTAGVEYVNYQGANFRFDDRDAAAEDFVNEDIDLLLEDILNVQVGGEFNLNPVRLRAGVQVRPSAIADSDVTNFSYHAGVGYFKDRFFVDAAYILSEQEQDFAPYQTTIVPPQIIGLDQQNHQLLFTIGFKFQ